MKIEVIGSGCPKCKKLFELTEKAVLELNLDIKVEYSKNIQKIISFGIMQSPVVFLDDKPIVVGILPDKDKLKEIILKNI